MLYEILKDFAGSQDGRFTEQFKAGTTAEISEYLASKVGAGWIKPVIETVAVEIENKAIITDGKRKANRK